MLKMSSACANYFSSHGIQVWLTGGWGIDALLGLQTRPHHDLDVHHAGGRRESACWSSWTDQGYTYKELWEENLWTEDANGTRMETAFFLRDADGREFDAHAMRLDEQGNGIPAWEKAEGFIFTPQYLAEEGTVAGYPVRCMSAEYQMVSHTGYELPEKQSAGSGEAAREVRSSLPRGDLSTAWIDAIHEDGSLEILSIMEVHVS